MPTITGRLGPREIETIRRIARGLSTAQIAHELHVTKGTVRSYVRGIYHAYGVTTREDPVRVGRQLGVVTDACPLCGS